MKAISAIIATIMLLMISVSLIGVFYVFSSGMASTSTSSASEQASQLTKQLSSCMRIENINGNQVILTNCGKGVIENKSLVVMMDDVKLGASTLTIQEGNSSIVNVTGLWQIAPGKHSLKISNGAAVAQVIVDVQPNKDGLAGSWSFDAGTGSKAYDDSGNNNIGTLGDGTCQPGFGSCPSWIAGKFNKGLQFDGSNDYVNVGNASSLNMGNKFTLEAWLYPKSIGTNMNIICKYRGGSETDSYCIKIDTDGTIFFWFKDTSASWLDAYSTTAININQWSHVVGLYDGTYMRIYLNGKELIEANSPDNVGAHSVLVTSKPVIIGAEIYNNASWFNGTIDEVRIWNKSFTPDETVIMKQII